MSGTNTTEGGIGFAYLSAANVGSALLSLLTADDIVPGSAPSYELCKTIYVSHPLGSKMAEAPINMAQSQDREITVSTGPEEELIAAFKREWASIGTIGADVLIHNTMKTARIYGIASIGVGERGRDPAQPLKLDTLHKADLYFNVFDPLNTAGSLVLNQDPNAPDYQKPTTIRVAGRDWHTSRTAWMMNEQPVYIEWSNSAYGFVGRSVYQRALFPLKSFVQSMLTDQYVTQKIGLLVAKMKQPGSIMAQRAASFFGWKRQQLQAGNTGNVLSIGEGEDIASLNFQNLEGAGRFTRDNILKNIAAAANMPARMLDQETLVSGFGEGAEDAKQIARYIDRVRIEMYPLYSFFDAIVQRRAWSPDFYRGLQKHHDEYRDVPYDTVFYQWTNGFDAAWPNLLIEPDSEKAKTEDVRFKAVVSCAEVLAPLITDADNKASLAMWVADEINSRKRLFSTPLILDEDALREGGQDVTQVASTAAAAGPGSGKEREPLAFSTET